jgi:2-polyprenyl-3-methyl-5-hydroxy-6-metoxy-1,4-benzoquinol methylase
MKEKTNSINQCFLKVKSCKFPNLNGNIFFSYKYKNINYLECKICKLSFQERITNSNIKEELNKIYSKNYFIDTYQRKNLLFRQRVEQYKLDKKIICDYFTDNTSKDILDYGCGNGIFLGMFKGKKFGYEVNREIIKKKNIIYLTTGEIKSKKFDLIIMRGVIEHILDFERILKYLFKSLKKNGHFYITATPNNLGLGYFLNKKQFNQNAMGHVYHFNHINLSYFFLNNNFLNIHTSFEYSKTPYKKYNNDYIKLKKLNDNKNNTMPPTVGNMMTLVFKKMY